MENAELRFLATARESIAGLGEKIGARVAGRALPVHQGYRLAFGVSSVISSGE